MNEDIYLLSPAAGPYISTPHLPCNKDLEIILDFTLLGNWIHSSMLILTQHHSIDAVELNKCSIRLTSNPLHCFVMNDAVIELMNSRGKETLEAKQK